MKAVRAPLRSISALVASVVPWMTRSTSVGFTPASASADAIPCSTACSGARGVVRTLVVTNRLPICTAMSVKVPPMSTPTRTSLECVLIALAFPIAVASCPADPHDPVTQAAGVSRGGIGASAIGFPQFGKTLVLEVCHGRPQYQREVSPGQRRSTHASVVGAARHAGHDGHQV